MLSCCPFHFSFLPFLLSRSIGGFCEGLSVDFVFLIIQNSTFLKHFPFTQRVEYLKFT